MKVEIKIGNRIFPLRTEAPYLMGILNVTADSFSDGGKWNTAEAALRHAETLIRDGADILDVGCESTRPGYRIIPAEEEAEKTAEIIRLLKSHFDVPLSVDTYKPEVFLEASRAGADLLNDIWGLRCPEDLLEKAGCRQGLSMADVLRQTDAPAVLMHQDLLSRDPAERRDADYRAAGLDPAADADIVRRIRKGWQASLDAAGAAGVSREKIILDPGVGFSKTQEENLACLTRLRELKEVSEEMGCCLLLGVSRKSVIGNILPGKPEERDTATAVLSVMAMERGAKFVRVHDVRATKDAITMWQAVREGK